MRDKRPVLHSVEYLARLILGRNWKGKCRKAARGCNFHMGVRYVDMDSIRGLVLETQETEADD